MEIPLDVCSDDLLGGQGAGLQQVHKHCNVYQTGDVFVGTCCGLCM